MDGIQICQSFYSPRENFSTMNMHELCFHECYFFFALYGWYALRGWHTILYWYIIFVLMHILFCYEMDEDMEFSFFCAQTVALIYVLGYCYSYGHRDRVHNSILSGESSVDELLIGHYNNCLGFLWINKGCYVNLSNELRQRGLLADSWKCYSWGAACYFFYSQ